MKSLAAFLFVVLISHPGLAQWTQTSGPTGAYSHEILSLGNYLFVNGFYGGVYRSADNGETWQLIDNGLPRSYVCLAMDIDNSNVYIASSQGVYYSSDFGDSWISISDMSVVGFSIEAIGNEIFVGFHNGVLYYSPDHGNTWQTLQVNPQISVFLICKFGNTIWIGADKVGFHYSQDGGVNWLTVPLNILVTGIDVSDGDLYVSGNDWNNGGSFEVFRSSDQGATWTKIFSTTVENNLSQTGFVKNGNEIFISGASYYYSSANNGTSWTTHPLPTLFTFYPWSSIAIVDNGLLIGYGNGLVFTNNSGTTWVPRNTGYRNHVIDNIVGTENAIVSLSATNGAHISTDHGDQWKQIHDPSLGLLPYNIYAYDDAIVMSYSYHVYKSTDLGDSWQQILTPDYSGLNRYDAAHIAGFEESLVATSIKGVYFSRNMGDSWNFVSQATFGSSDLLKSYVQHDTVIVLTQDEMFMSTNFGTTWQKKTVPDFPVDNLSIQDININGRMLTLATGFGMYKSLDLGLTWKIMPEFSGENIFDIDRVGDRVILGTYSGVYVSGINGGWYAVNDGLNGYIPNTIFVSDGYSYVGTRGQSVWRIGTADLLTPRELIYAGAPGVAIPQLTADCSTVTITNATQGVVIRWYKNGVLIADQSDKILESTGPAAYTASFENETDIKLSAPAYIHEPDKEPIVVYNVVTANSDGKNDKYILSEELIGSKLMVINRWGEIVYSHDSYHNDWSPDQISPGQYFYLIENKCLGKFKGVLTVMK